MMTDFFHKKQMEFIINSNARWNLAHGAVRTGKTVCTTFRFLQAADQCPDSDIYIVGHTFDTAYRNVVRMILESPELAIFRPFCTWSGKKLYFKDKVITVLGAKDEGSIGAFQGPTFSLVLCDEMTLYPQSIIEMINTRLSRPYSLAFAAMNPQHPEHICKKWIDAAIEGDTNYYQLHFALDDNPFIDDDYKRMVTKASSGVFYRRNVLGEWCLAEGTIFDFFDKKIYVVQKPPRAAEYWIAGIDYGTKNNFACVLVGINTGLYTQTGISRWVEAEYIWDSVEMKRQKTSSEYADDVQKFLEDYNVKGIYIDPSAASFKLELQKRGMHVIDADNDVFNGIQYMCSEMQKGSLLICKQCTKTIKEIEGYVWDSKKGERGEDAPLKRNDHAIDALRYAVFTHKIKPYQPYKHNPTEYTQSRFTFNQRGNF
jgi:PBSX family phage terminase large subunit